MAFDVSTADIELLWRPLDTDESDVAFQRLEQAQRRLRVLRPDLEAGMAAITTTIAAMPSGAAKTAAQAKYDDLVGTIRDVLCEVVIAYLRNPDRYRSQNIDASGGIGIGYDVGGREAPGGIQFSDSDLAAIDAAVATASGATYSRSASRVLRTSTPYYRPDLTVLPSVN